VELVFLVEPQRRELNEYLWDKKGWDILFFAGHSQTEGETGRIYLNKTDSLTIADLKNSLRAAISRGLQLAIFNSCDGLGLARQLEDLHLNQLIVMREPVSDLVAQEFLKYFLGAFAYGEPFYLAVREARERLQGLETQCFCASWLPVICQNLTTVPPTWRDLRQPSPSISLWRQFLTVCLLSLAVTGLLVGIRQLGLLQVLELQAFDQLMRMRPAEPPDQRILVIKVTEEDIQAQGEEQRKSSLPDQTLEQLLKQLEPLQPRVIGLDIYRDFPVGKEYPNLATSLKRIGNFIGICKVREDKKNPDIPPPPEIPNNRIGFSDIVIDPDGVVRGQLLGMAIPQSSTCQTDKSLSLQVALHYLEKENINAEVTNKGNLKIGSVIFPNLEANTGGYHQLDASGFQVMLNYRAGEQQTSIDQVTLTQALTGEIEPNLVRDRVILIGTAAASITDHHLTPYSAGQWPIEKLPGVVIQGHMVSQILSAVLDQRTLLWVLPKSGEIFWIASWSLVGGILAWRLRSKPLVLGVATFTAIGILSGLCFVLLLRGGWIPLVPSVFVLVTTSGTVALVPLCGIKN
ncbi:MAG: CHASE2 domain-containing protein, partial [Symploca sp. SIO1A3]|nr:CHASE2 domain-containing protein [Symploca sp. SIO1A3]